jgi:hypothetical protein
MRQEKFSQSEKRDSSFQPTGLRLQRKCACGQHTIGGGACSECEQTKNAQPLQRAAAHAVSDNIAPPIVHDALNSSGRPLDQQTRAHMETRFNHDFSRVRVHTDDKAAESARAINSLAYTVGHQVVFGAGQYAPETSAGRGLLGHELTHVVQQGYASHTAGTGALMIDDNHGFEHEADAAAKQLDEGHALTGLAARPANGLQRKVIVDKPTADIPNPTGKGVKQTNAVTVQNYLGELCSGETPNVDGASGEVSMSGAFCFVPGMQIGHEVLPTGPAPATESKTPTGCTCLCDLVHSKNVWTIKVDDVSRPHTSFDDPKAAIGETPGGTGGFVTTISPNSPKVFGSVSASGKRVDYDPWLILGHELCGHGWLGNYGMAEGAEIRESVGRQPLTIDRENALRAEHQIEARGRSFRDPFCGESYERFKTDKDAKATKAGTGTFDTGLMDFCTRARARCKKPDKKLFKIDEKIPETVSCGK